MQRVNVNVKRVELTSECLSYEFLPSKRPSKFRLPTHNFDMTRGCDAMWWDKCGMYVCVVALCERMIQSIF